MKVKFTIVTGCPQNRGKTADKHTKNCERYSAVNMDQIRQLYQGPKKNYCLPRPITCLFLHLIENFVIDLSFLNIENTIN